MSDVPVRPQARVAVTTALGSKLHWIKDAERATELADTAIQAFLAAEGIAEQRGRAERAEALLADRERLLNVVRNERDLFEEQRNAERTRAVAAEAERDALKEALGALLTAAEAAIADPECEGKLWASHVKAVCEVAPLAASVSKEEARDGA